MPRASPAHHLVLLFGLVEINQLTAATKKKIKERKGPLRTQTP
jgi:hypothetical protein